MNADHLDDQLEAFRKDEQCTEMLVQIGAILSALAARAHELCGLELTPAVREMMLRVLWNGLGDFERQRQQARRAETVVSIRELADAARPAVLPYATVTLGDSLAVVDHIAEREHGVANNATRALVLNIAIERGLRAAEESNDC